ncbi:MAG: hypothetical protein ABFQ62_00215 [Patescibacteria group bacterium]
MSTIKSELVQHGLAIGFDKLMAKYDHKVKDPYWELKNELGGQIFEHYLRGPFKVELGKLTSFNTEILATFVRGIITAYLSSNIYKRPPQEGRETLALLAHLLGGFREQQAAVIVTDKKTKKIVGGCTLVQGSNEKPVGEIIGTQTATIPTLIDLLINLPSTELPEFELTPEHKVVGFNRFWRLPNDQIDQLTNGEQVSKYLKHFSMEVLAAMARAAYYLANEQITHGVLDTHDPKVVKTLTQYYGGVTLDDQPRQTEHTRRSIARLHYDKADQGEITVIAFLLAKQIELARQTDQALGPKEAIHG